MESRLTSKYQVTLPRQVREALNLSAGDHVEFVVNASHVSLRRVTDGELGDLRADDAAFDPEWLSTADNAAWRHLGRANRLTKSERRRRLAAFDELVPQIAKRPAGAAAKEIAAIRSARHGTQTRRRSR